MIKISTSISMLAGALLVAGCSFYDEAGLDLRDAEYGVANRANFAAQVAYRLGDQRLIDLGKDFAANTSDTVTFAFNSSVLDESARAAIDTQIAWLKKNKNLRMTIIGHTDLVGSKRYNYGLGLRRARAVMRYMNSRGITRRRLDAIASRGELEPVIPTTERERRNRRAQTVVSGFYRKYVGPGMDGEYAAKVFDNWQGGPRKVTKADSSVN